MKHYGDICKIDGSKVEPVDIICGGSPCQDLSVAGKRAGLAGERSGLFMEQIRIIKEMRENDRRYGRTDISIRPRFMVWENVPGAFSSNKGEDFRAVLEETAKVAERDACIPRLEKWPHAGCIMGDGWSIAWRVHDAQFWGVPQRRKRIALVADFAGGAAPEILFEREGLSRDTSESREEGQGTAENSERSTNPTSYTLKIRGGREIDSLGHKAGKGALIQTELSATLGVSQDQTLICLNDQGGHQMSVTENISGTLRAHEHGHQPIVYGISAYESNAMKSANPHSGVYEADTARTLDLNGGSPACNQGGMAVVQGADVYNGLLTGDVAATLTEACGGTNTSGAKVVCLEGNGSRDSHKGDGYKESDTMYTLNTVEQHVVAYRGDAITSPINASNPKPGDPCHTLTDDSRNYVVLENHPADSRVKISDDNIVQTLSGRMGTGGGNVLMVLEEPYTSSKASYHQRFTHDRKAETLVASDYKDPPTITYGLDRASYNQGKNAKFGFCIDEEKIGAQVAKGPGAVCNDYVVRRLTPMECERLQGFPDHWTDIGEWVDSKGKKHKDADSPRYKALGNSIALPFWEWMADRMVKVLKEEGCENPTMGSLFDGIGGFPLVYQRCGCKPVWASEIEEFPIAVTKLRFSEEVNK